MNIMQMRRGMGASGGGGGSVYETYDYLEVNGDAYIDTGVFPSSSLCLATRAYLTQETGGNVLFGSRDWSGSSITKTWTLWYTTSGGTYKMRYDRNSNQIVWSNFIVNQGWHDISISPSEGMVDGLSTGLATFNTTSDISIYLSAVHTKGNQFFYNQSGLKLKITLIYNSNGFGYIRNYVPCKLIKNTNDTWDGNTHYIGECGMWDKENNIFYGNAHNSGYFTVGND